MGFLRVAIRYVLNIHKFKSANMEEERKSENVKKKRVICCVFFFCPQLGNSSGRSGATSGSDGWFCFQAKSDP